MVVLGLYNKANLKFYNNLKSLKINMKKILTLIFILIAFSSYAVEKKTTFTNEIFQKAQKDGKIVVINSWQKSCFTCKKQIKILDQAEKKFNDI